MSRSARRFPARSSGRPNRGTIPASCYWPAAAPTDRNWDTPLLTDKASPGKQLAEALAQHGAVVLRFDKANVGGNHNAITNDTTIDVYRDEGRAALALLRARPDVDPAHLYLAGHSEGALHAIRIALVEPRAIAGVILLAPTARTLEDILLAQLAAQLRPALPKDADAILASIRKAFDDFLAGNPVDPATVTSIPGLRNLVSTIVAPQTAALGRSMLALDPVPLVKQVDVPMLVIDGDKDIQTDPELDAKVLAQARTSATKPVTLFISPAANHFLESETRSIAELRGNLAGAYKADGKLDPAVVSAIVSWLAKH